MDKAIDVKKLSDRTVNGRNLNVSGGRESERLGYVVLFTVGSVEVPHDEIKKWWANQDVLPIQRMPKRPTAFDAFRNTCSMENIGLWEKVDEEQKMESEKYFGKPVRVEYLVVSNPQNKDEYIFERRIWLPPVDGKDEKMVVPEYPNIARLRFNNQKDEIETVPFENYEGSDVIVDIDRVANDEYKRQKNIVNGNRHRGLIRDVIESCGGIHMMGGQGTYFIPADGYEKLEALVDYFDNVASKYASTSHASALMTLDAYDDEKMRKRIQQDVENEVGKMYGDLLDETLEYLEGNAAKTSEKDGERISKAIEARLASAGKINALKGQYEQLLGTKIQIKKAVASAPADISGRAKAVLNQMERMLEPK
jgi:hypothetical protein